MLIKMGYYEYTNSNGGDKMEKENKKKDQVDKMTEIWAKADDYGKGYLDGIIETVMRMAEKGTSNHPVV